MVPLPARTDVSALATGAVMRAATAASRLAGLDESPAIDPVRLAVAYSSERWLRCDGRAQVGFAPLSAFFRTSDGGDGDDRLWAVARVDVVAGADGAVGALDEEADDNPIARRIKATKTGKYMRRRVAKATSTPVKTERPAATRNANSRWQAPNTAR